MEGESAGSILECMDFCGVEKVFLFAPMLDIQSFCTLNPTPHLLRTFLPEGPSYRPEHSWVAEEGGRLLVHLRVFDRSIRAGGAERRASGGRASTFVDDDVPSSRKRSHAHVRADGEGTRRWRVGNGAGTSVDPPASEVGTPGDSLRISTDVGCAEIRVDGGGVGVESRAGGAGALDEGEFAHLLFRGFDETAAGRLGARPDSDLLRVLFHEQDFVVWRADAL